ncbi:MAG: hypothetical protein GWN18_20255, partial [Thermoplasmata archaeon]|nr:hypothetical protein [Thermoplasmata archaeon]NIS14458.1 hypothetical protein [Thermoplasmata archaeon]NIS22308.1 hypothetical protein [Thermoplasmata archaeon]NIT80185.1 hypothetical protein [Thermoplasmata archaeon]NIU51313.1 hypothetical protein [Thermoplasmata archaeon]
TVTLNKTVPDHQVFVEAWSEIPYGLGQNDHMLNRTYYRGDRVSIQFTAPHTGTYYLRVFRYFYSHGTCDYDITVSK